MPILSAHNLALRPIYICTLINLPNPTYNLNPSPLYNLIPVICALLCLQHLPNHVLHRLQIPLMPFHYIHEIRCHQQQIKVSDPTVLCCRTLE